MLLILGVQHCLSLNTLSFSLQCSSHGGGDGWMPEEGVFCVMGQVFELPTSAALALRAQCLLGQSRP
ncbi:hypothetical protein CesoFtcFv8_004849 [Champsocephalus esox]|uniref:Secreted protein n=2 Tax=Champsocephalus TaxID=52236 RepID=A0AAN8HVL7_CHAGU|nr:hypothetical protein CesoFtcFv8_004849 [Champsocephalus esox]KAK5930529.1 hypothetical protein CgunFtcFv8_026756 [Champsocephalus gunnari]